MQDLSLLQHMETDTNIISLSLCITVYSLLGYCMRFMLCKLSYYYKADA